MKSVFLLLFLQMYIFFNVSTFLSSPRIHILSNLGNNIVPHIAEAVHFFQSFLSLCFVFDNFCCCVFRFTSVFFSVFHLLVFSQSVAFFILDIVVLITRSSTWIFFLYSFLSSSSLYFLLHFFFFFF